MGEEWEKWELGRHGLNGATLSKTLFKIVCRSVAAEETSP